MSEVTHRLATKDSIEALQASIAQTIGSNTAAITALPNATQEAADAATAAAADAETAIAALGGLVAKTYSTLETYAVGDYAYNDPKLYRCSTPIETPEAWTSGHWTEVSLGDDVAGAMRNVEDLIFESRNIMDTAEFKALADNDGMFRYVFPYPVPAGKYMLTVKSTCSPATSDGLCYARFSSKETYSSAYTVSSNTFPNNKTYAMVVTLSAAAKSLWFMARATSSGSESYTLAVQDVSLVRVGYALNQETMMETGDSADRTDEIVQRLTLNGVCRLGSGTFYIDQPIVMPAGTMIEGCGSSTKIIYAGAVGSAILMGDRCTVRDVEILGGTEDIDVSLWAWTGEDDPGATNVWPNNASISTSSSGYIHQVLNTPLQPGTYNFTCSVSREGSATGNPYIAFSTSQTTSISDNTFVDKVAVPVIGETVTVTVSLTKTCYSFRLSSATSANSGVESTWSSLRMTAVDPQRSGIGWIGDSCQYGVVTGCRIARFTYAGILMLDTGTPTDHSLAVSNCNVWNCGCGYMMQRNAEFNKISNSSATWCYYGLLNRGGNNKVDNCGLDRNTVNIQIDNDQGENGGHGSISNCTVNHAGSNEGYGMIIRGIGRMLVTNCNFYYADIRLENTDGNVISNCGFGRDSEIEISGGECNILIGCMMRATANTITAYNNTKTKVVSCWTLGGVEMEVTTSDTPI